MTRLRWRTRREVERLTREAALQDSAVREVEHAMALDRPTMVRVAADVIARNHIPDAADTTPDEGRPDAGRRLFELVSADEDRGPVLLVGSLSDEGLVCEVCERSASLTIYDLVEPVMPSWMELEIQWCSRGHGQVTLWLKGHYIREAHPRAGDGRKLLSDN